MNTKKAKNWALALLVVTLIVALVGCEPLAIDPSGRFAYIAQGYLYAYSIDPTTGKVSLVESHDMGYDVQSAVIDPSGRFVYVLSNNDGSGDDGKITAWSIDQTTGALTQVTNGGGAPLVVTPGGAGASISALTVDPQGRYLFASDNALNILYMMLLDPRTGAPYAASSVALPTEVSPDKLVVDPTGQFLYALNSGDSGLVPPVAPSISVFSIYDSDPTLTRVSNLPLSGTVAGMTIDKNGRFLYAGVCDASRENCQVVGFSCNASAGTLTADGAGVPVGNSLQTLAFDPSNRFLYAGAADDATGSGSGTVWGFNFDSTAGALSAINGSPFAGSSNIVQLLVTGKIKPSVP